MPRYVMIVDGWLVTGIQVTAQEVLSKEACEKRSNSDNEITVDKFYKSVYLTDVEISSPQNGEVLKIPACAIYDKELVGYYLDSKEKIDTEVSNPLGFL